AGGGVGAELHAELVLDRRRPRGRQEQSTGEVADRVVHVLQRRRVVVHGVRRRVVDDAVGEAATVGTVRGVDAPGGHGRGGELRRLRAPVPVEALGDRGGHLVEGQVAAARLVLGAGVPGLGDRRRVVLIVGAHLRAT